MEIIDIFTKKTKEVSGFDHHQTLVTENIFFSVVSAFTTSVENKKNIHWYDNELASFDTLVTVRKEYLDMLPSLAENWISGNSSLPNPAVIEKSKKLLDGFNSYLIQKKKQMAQIDVPKLVMGPIPAGGIGIEFHVNSENALYVSILNNSTVKIELKCFDFYSTIEPTYPDRGVIADYELLINTNRNSRWGNTLSLLQPQGIS